MGNIFTFLIIIGVVLFLLFRFKNNLKGNSDIAKHQNEDNKNILRQAKFNISKKILITDFLPEKEHLWLGEHGAAALWADYLNKRFAISTSELESKAQIYNFSQLLSYDIVEEANSTYVKNLVGGAVSKVCDSYRIKVGIEGAHGARNEVNIILLTKKGAGVSSTHSLYKAVAKCAQSMMDELGNIKRLSK